MSCYKRLIPSRSLTLMMLLLATSFVIRLAWMLYVQAPGDALDSDSAGYIGRAQALVSGTQERHWSAAVIPYGTHYLYALVMFLFGQESYTALAVVQALLGSVCVVCVTRVAAYCFTSAAAICLVGALSCVWYPIIAYGGYFMSEVPYSFFMYLGLLLTFRYLKSGKGAVLTGLVHGLAFTIRPQIIMTFILFVAWAIARRKSLSLLTVRSLSALVLPVALIVGYSACRYYYFTGDLGLISGNGAATRLLGATECWMCQAYTYRDGKPAFSYGFTRPRLAPFERQFSFEGRLIDADIISSEMKSCQSKRSLRERILLKARNLVLLVVYRDTMCPEWQRARKTAWRRGVFEAWYVLVLFCCLPLMVVGLLVLPVMRNPYLEVIGLHVLTLLYAAYGYLGQIRYRVPYDLMLTIVAVLGVLTVYEVVRNLTLRFGEGRKR